MAQNESLSPPPPAVAGWYAGSALGEASARQWYVLLVLSLVYALNIADRYVITTVMESIRLDLHLTDSAVALLTGVALALFYVSAGIPISALADRYSRRNIIAAALVIWSALTVFTGLSRTFGQMMVARIGVGIGESGGTPPSTSMLADYFKPRHRTMALTIWALGASLGAWLGADVAGRVADAYGWRTAFLAMGVPGVVMGIVIFTTVREPRRGVMDGGDAVSERLAVERAATKVPMMVALRVIASQPATLHLMMGGAVTALWGWGLMWWTPTYLQRAYHMTAGEAGAMLGPMHLIAGSLSTIGTCLLMATPAMADPKRVLRLMAIVVAVVTVPSFFIFWTHDLGITRLCLWLLVPAMYFYIGPSYGLINNTIPPQIRAMAAAVTLLVANIANLVIAPQFVGFVSDHVAGPGGADAASLRFALLLLAPTGFWAAYHFWAATKKIDQEIARVRDAVF
jgi:MFS family permease